MYLVDYLKLKCTNLKITKKYFECPFKHEHTTEVDYPTANVSTNNLLFCSHPSHKKIGNIFDVVRKMESGMTELDNEDIAEYLVQLFDIKTDKRIENLFAKYQSLDWSLVPIAKGGKEAWVEKEWQKKVHKNIQEWQDWISAGLNLGVNCGLSSVIILDIDAMPKVLKDKWYAGTITEEEKKEAIKIKNENLEKVLKVLDNPKTLTQDSLGGVHLFFEGDDDIPKTWIDIEGVHIDIETKEGQVLVEPSIVKGIGRKMNDNPITKIPDEIKKLILSKRNDSKSEIKETILADDTELSFENLNQNRNNTFIKLGGELRKKMNVAQTGYAMYLFNSLLDKQLPQKELKAMLREVEKYRNLDIEELSKQVIERLEKVEEATIRDITYSLRQEQKDIEDVLRYLVDKDLVYRRGTKYRLFKKATWQTEFMQASKLLDFKVPYFNDYVTFRNGDMIVIGGRTGEGKSHIALNMIKKFQEQGLITNYISSEPGNRFAKIAMTLGLKEGEIRWCNHYRPEQVELEDNAITIVDWLLPENYAETDKLYAKFAQQLDKHGGLLIIFAQLREEGKFWADGMIDFFASVCCTYNMTPIKDKSGNISYDTENTFFETRKIRESRSGRQHIIIPMRYNISTKELDVRKHEN